MALAAEVGELLELFQWLTPDEADGVMKSPRKSAQVRGELADIFAYLLRLADVLDVDLMEALREKMQVNEERYPIELSRGRAAKYHELEKDVDYRSRNLRGNY
jgi:dCTP diphosphatase